MNYAELQEIIASYIDQAPEDTRATTYIKMCEAAINKRLRSEGMETLETVPGDGTSEYDLPKYTGSLRNVSVNGLSLEFATAKQLLDATNVGAGVCAFNRQRFKLLFNAAIEADSSISYLYHLMVPALTDTETTNWLLTDWEDIYINGSIYEACMFHKDYDAASLWKTRFEESLQSLIDIDLEDRWSGASMQIRSA